MFGSELSTIFTIPNKLSKWVPRIKSFKKVLLRLNALSHASLDFPYNEVMTSIVPIALIVKRAILF